MAAELLILLGAVLGALGVVTFVQVRKMLLEKQVDFSDLDDIVKKLFELELNKEFFLKLALGTGLGAAGAVLFRSSLFVNAPVEGTALVLIGYGFGWGFAGNGILKVFQMFPEGFLNVLKLNNEIKTLRIENNGLKMQVNTLQQFNQSLGANKEGEKEKGS